tara:strand:- start:6226 stop:7473 length:1248 start_codon:yes stop_codon:yes gene_type:complete
MGKTLKKKDLTPEQWSSILKAVSREKQLKAEREYLLELKEYEQKLKLKERLKKQNEGDDDIVDEIYKLFYNGLTKKEVLKLLEEDDGSKALSLSSIIDRIDLQIREQQRDVYEEEIETHLKNKTDDFYKSNEFTTWAQDYLDSSQQTIDVGGQSYGLGINYDYNDGVWNEGELEHLKNSYADYLYSLSDNEETGFLNDIHVWDMIDVHQFLSNPEYITSHSNPDKLGITLNNQSLPGNESLFNVFKNTNDRIFTSTLFKTRLRKLDSELFQLGLNNEELLKDEYPKLHNVYQSKVNSSKSNLRKNVIPELNNNDIEIDDEFIKKEQNDVKKDSTKTFEFKFNDETSSRGVPKVFRKDVRSPENYYGGVGNKLGKPTIPSTPVYASDKPASSPAFASSKTRVDWSKVTGKKWHEKA